MTPDAVQTERLTTQRCKLRCRKEGLPTSIPHTHFPACGTADQCPWHPRPLASPLFLTRGEQQKRPPRKRMLVGLARAAGQAGAVASGPSKRPAVEMPAHANLRHPGIGVVSPGGSGCGAHRISRYVEDGLCLSQDQSQKRDSIRPAAGPPNKAEPTKSSCRARR